jgi:hypothetical protein
MDDVRGWGGGERRQGGGERLPGLLEVSSRLSIVEGVGDGSYCTSRDGGGGSVLLWHQSFTSRQGQASADDRCQAELSGQVDGGALLQEYFALLD